MLVPVSSDEPAVTRDAVGAAVDAGFTHIDLSLRAPYPSGLVRRIVDEIVTPLRR